MAQNSLIAALVITLFFSLIWEWFELPTAEERVLGLPTEGKNFIGRQVPLQDWERHFFKDTLVVKRLYTVGGQSCFVTLLDGTRNRHSVHDPLYCLRGEGWQLQERVDLPVPGGSAHVLRLEKEGASQEALFWFSDGRQRHASMLRYLLQTTLRRLTLGRSGPEPVRVMITPVRAAGLDWATLVQEFPELFQL